jgi:hypothetical protein
MGYDDLKEAPWLIDEEVEQQVRQTAAEKDLSPGEAFRKSIIEGSKSL